MPLWSDLTNGQSVTFDPNTDVLVIDDSSLTAAALTTNNYQAGASLTLNGNGKTITLLTDIKTLTTANIVFLNGTLYLAGDNNVGTANDDAANTLTGGNGNDRLIGFDGNDSLAGGGGNDFFFGYADIAFGSDTIDGGAGTDTLNFSAASVAAAVVNLTTGLATSANGSISLSGIENVNGSLGNDGITGSAAANILWGRDGSDAISGLGGADTLLASAGADTLDGGTGSDTLDFAQTGIAYAGGTAVSVNLATHVADIDRGAGGLDSTLISIETVLGTAGDDLLVGGDAEHVPDSLGNALSEFFRGGAGNDTITGGADLGPTFGLFTHSDYSTNTNVQAVNANLSTGIVSDGLGGTDLLTNVDGVRGGAGNDTLLGGSLSRALSGTFFEIFRGNAGNDIINGNNAGSGGTDSSGDRADYATSIAAVNVNLATGVALDGLGGTDTLSDIDNVYGGAGIDTLTGSANNDDLDGGAGSDTLDGGAGSDTARFQQSGARVIVNLSAGTIVVDGVSVAAGTANDGTGGTDTLISMENVRGSDFGDHIRGSDDPDTRQFFQGDAGNDTIDGGAGIDFASYSANARAVGGINATLENGSGTVNDGKSGTDTLINIEGLGGTQSNDTLTGGLGEQWFRGLGGNDILSGGAGIDWVLYSNSPSGVSIDLAAGTAADGWNGANSLLALGGTDTLISIENAEASDYDDAISGNADANELRGRAGNDSLNGGNGNDTLDGGAGIDSAVYSGAAAAVSVNLQNGTASGADAGNDTFTSIENAVGGQGADILVGSTGNNAFAGNAGNDYVYARDGNDRAEGGAGVDVLLGEGGNDALFGGDDTDYLYGGSGTNTLGGDGGVDVLYSQGSGDTLNGGEGGDYLYAFPGAVAPIGNGGNGNDIYTDLAGGAGANDNFNGEAGQDYFYGFAGNDTFSGGAGVDVFLGGDGNDRFEGGEDVDYAFGDAGDDLFVVRAGGASDVIGDFTAGGTEDQVLLAGAGLNSFAEVLAATTYFSGLNTSIVTLPDGSNVWLVGVHVDSLTAADFAFA